MEVFFKTGVVEALEGFDIVKRWGERVGNGGVLVENVELEVVGRLVTVAGAATANIGLFEVDVDGAFGCFSYGGGLMGD